MARAVRTALPRWAPLGETLEQARPARAHWHLFHLGAEPEQQARAIGTALLRSQLARGDTDGDPAYLECCEANIGYYQRFGFQVRDTLTIDTTLTVHTMWREPRPSPT